MSTENKSTTKTKKKAFVSVKQSNNPTMKITKVKKEKQKKKKNPEKTKKIINVLLSIIMILGIFVMIAIISFSAYIALNAPPFEADKLYSTEATILYDKNGDEFARLGREQRDIVKYEELPEVLIDAIVATEDSRFFQHNGFDFVRFVKASLGQLAGQDGAGGASTLTMQVAKNSFSKDEATGKIASSGIAGIIRKFNDIYISVFKIEKNYTKEEIIEFYVNAPGLGNNTFGVEQASRKYFGKSVSNLTLPEASLLAGIFNAPSLYNPYYSPELASQRRAVVLNLMVRHGYITEEQAEGAKNISVESLTAESTSVGLNRYQQFIDIVCDEVEKKYGVNPANVPMEIYTTMDPAIQEVYVALNNQDLDNKGIISQEQDPTKLEKRKKNAYVFQRSYMKSDFIQIASIVTDVHDGSIRGVNGGRNQTRERALSQATRGVMQPGSTAKPIFAYGPYIEYNNGNTGTIFYDNKMNYSNGQSIKNSDGKFKGAMTMRDALSQSRNIPAVQAFQAVDKEKIAEFVHNCGIDYGDTLLEAFAIGGGLEVNPKIMAAAYGTFARGGYYIEPYTFTKIVFRETDEVEEIKPEWVKAMSSETAYMITDILRTAAQNKVGGVYTGVRGTEIAAKTGTSTYDANFLKQQGIPSSASDDNWAISYSPDYVIALWYGVEFATKDAYTDSVRAANEVRTINTLLVNNIYKENSKFNRPSNVIAAEYENETIPAELPSEYTPQDYKSTELFKKGTEPSVVSERFSELSNPTKGEAISSGGTIKLSWEGIPTPNAINTSYLDNYFTKNYGKFKDIYLEKRFEYNNTQIGTVGYHVYLSTPSGLISLGYTTNTSYEYTVTAPGTYTFVVKSEYSIFKSNASSGLTITAKIKDITSVEPSNPDDDTSSDDKDSDNEDDKKEDNPSSGNSQTGNKKEN